MAWKSTIHAARAQSSCPSRSVEELILADFTRGLIEAEQIKECLRALIGQSLKGFQMDRQRVHARLNAIPR